VDWRALRLDGPLRSLGRGEAMTVCRRRSRGAPAPPWLLTRGPAVAQAGWIDGRCSLCVAAHLEHGLGMPAHSAGCVCLKCTPSCTAVIKDWSSCMPNHLLVEVGVPRRRRARASGLPGASCRCRAS